MVVHSYSRIMQLTPGGVKLVLTTLLCLAGLSDRGPPMAQAQTINRTPHFIPGSGDMSRFSLPENTPVGSVVYQLRGTDPEGSKLRFSISGPVFSVDRDSGVVRLRQSLDREQQDTVEVIISITDEGILGTEPNTVSLRREIPIRDYNDNPPVFVGRPYSATVSESTRPGSNVSVVPDIIATDQDEGVNAELSFSCYQDPTKGADDICETFAVHTEKMAQGKFGAWIELRRPPDFETRPSYVLTIQARDGSPTNALKAYATVAVTIVDVQDQPPVFINAPYSATIPENTIEGTRVLTINATDGDTGSPNPLMLMLEGETMGHFRLHYIGHPRSGVAELVTTGKPLDREDTAVAQNGGAYTFAVRATELINGELPGDSATSPITIVLTDVDDHRPEFSQTAYEVSIPENLEPDTPLPGLSIVVTDRDLGPNSRYSLALRDVRNSAGVFAVAPTHGEGRTPVVVKVLNSSRLDYDVPSEDAKTFTFELVASVDGEERSSATVTVHLQDANDNSPAFPLSSYSLKVRENAPRGFLIANISATDHDAGMFGQLRYAVKGFGAELFRTHPTEGGLYVERPLDYEEQKSYSLALVATDGGGRETNANVFVDVLDENDNYPAFEALEYTRTIREGATEFEPQFFVRATDADGPQQGGGRVSYAIESENSVSGHVFTVDRESGEIRITRPVNSMDTDRGQYELLVVATDHGVPPLKNDTRVLVRVGISGNQRPIFQGHSVAGRDIPGPPSYRATIPENAPTGTNVTQVSATDPDGLDDLLRYKIVGASDNFVIDDHTGLITVTRDARLDRDTNPESYTIVVNAIDAGFPIPETATTTVHVKIQDINDKPPRFTQQSYTAYVSERSPIGAEVLRVTAKDTDLDARLAYAIVEPITAVTKGGIPLLTTSSYDYRQAFRIDPSDGTLFVNSTLDYNYAAVITLTVEATDMAAQVAPESQRDRTEVTLYVQSFKDTNPLYRNKGWSTVRPKIEVKVKEEAPVGSVVFRIEADDPVADVLITDYELMMPDVDGFFALNERTGEVTLLRRLDYEMLNKTTIDFVVNAVTSNRKRHSLAYVNVTVENVNDNAPVFEPAGGQRATVLESDRFPHVVATVRATDQDAVRTDRDTLLGYSEVRYSLFGSHSNLFTIDNTTGEIRIAPGQTLDREKQSVMKLVVVAEDAPGRPQEARKATLELVVDVLDVNDNAPIFGQRSYTAVIPENVLVDTFVIAITAHDPDEGLGGEVRYDLLNEGEANGLLQINAKTGEIKTKAMLTGKGRSEPYELVVRAQDSGSQLPKQSSLYNDVSFTLYIGDISANDGIPFFIAPQVGQTANVTENATIGAPVFQVIASDPDSPATPSGTLRYRIQPDIEDAKSFSINPKTGLITTTRTLDRETKAAYNVIVEVSDMGEPPQAATVVLRINVLDIDDHAPRFEREVEAQPQDLTVLEEQPAGTMVGTVAALDEDIGANGAIDYAIVEGNELGLFTLARTDDNRAILSTTQPLDRESLELVRLTVRCFKLGSTDQLAGFETYNRFDRSQRQVVVRVVDIDDHAPRFERENQTIGIRHNVPIDTPIAHSRALDEDPDAHPIRYSIESITFVPQFYRRDNRTEDYTSVFRLNGDTGEIRTARAMSNFVDGYFQLSIRAANSDRPAGISETQMKIFVIRDKSLLRFVFARPPTEISAVLDRFAADMQHRLADANLELSVFDAQVLSHADHSLDFSSTSSCFQLTRHGSALAPTEMMRLMDSAEMKEALAEVYQQYSVHRIDSCAVGKKVPTGALIASSGTWLVILAGLIGFAAFASTMTACCLAKRYKSQVRSTINSQRIVGSDIYGSATPVLYTEPIYGAL